MNYIGTNEVSVLTLEERNNFLKQLTLDQKNVLYSYRKWLWISKFQTDIIGNTQWVFVGYDQDYDYEMHLGNRNRYHCECGRGVKYLYEIKSKDGEKSHFLGVNHLSQHLGISQTVVKEIIDKNNKVQYDIDNLLVRYFRGERYPQSLYECYKKAGCESSPKTSFENKLSDFSHANFPLTESEKYKMNKSIREVVFNKLSEKAQKNRVRISTLSKVTGIANRKIINMAQIKGIKAKSHSSFVTMDQVNVLLKEVDFEDSRISKMVEKKSLNRKKIASTLSYFDFPRSPFNIRDKDFILDIIYEAVHSVDMIKKDYLIEEVKNFYILHDEIEEFEELVNINQLIDYLVLEGRIYNEKGYLLSEKPTALQEKTSLLLDDFDNNIKEYIKEYVTVLPTHNEWLVDDVYMTGYILNVITKESPIHKKFLKTRLETMMGDKFDNGNFNDCIQKLITSAAIVQKDDFLYALNTKVKTIRKNSKNGLNCRRSNYISTEELEFAIHTLKLKNNSIKFEDIVKIMQDIFNIVNFSNKTKERIRNILHA